MRHLLLSAAALCLLAVLSSCTHHLDAEDERIVIEPSAQNMLAITDLAIGEINGGFQRVTLTASNRMSHAYHFEYNVQWFRDDNTPIESILTRPERFTLDPGAAIFIKFVSPSPEATTFKAQFRCLD
jgi:uncharacterized protein YcfL